MELFLTLEVIYEAYNCIIHITEIISIFIYTQLQ